MIKEITDFPGYFVTDDGRVFSTKRGEMKELKLSRNNDGYVVVGLCKNGDKKTVLVHRLVATAFISNPNNLPHVNHKDEDKTNNCVGNLEWCSVKYNSNYGTRNKRIGEANKVKMIGNTNRLGKYTTLPIICVETGRRWECGSVCDKELSEELGIKFQSGKVIIYQDGVYKGLHFKYVEPDDPNQLQLDL